jgi:hypothetical protein
MRGRLFTREYGALFPFTNNIIRFNISANDETKK